MRKVRFFRNVSSGKPPVLGAKLNMHTILIINLGTPLSADTCKNLLHLPLS